MIVQIPPLALIAALLLSCSACEDTPPQIPPPTPIEARLPTVDFDATQPIPAAIQIEVTPDHIRVSLDQLAPIWQRASGLRDVQIIEDGPWWCTYWRNRCLKREKKPGELSRLPALPVFPDISINNGEVPDSLREGPGDAFYIRPLFNQLRAARRYIDRNLMPPPTRNDPKKLIVAADERVPMSTILKMIYTMGQAKIRLLFFRVDAQSTGTQTVSYRIPRGYDWHETREDDKKRTYSALPSVALSSDAVYILLVALEKPEKMNPTPDLQSSAAEILTGRYENPPEYNCLLDGHDQTNCASVKTPNPDWANGVLVPEPSACESLRFLENDLPSGAVTKLLERYDKTEFYPGFVLATQRDVSFNTWIKLLAELQSFDAFRGTYHTSFLPLSNGVLPLSCEHIIVAD